MNFWNDRELALRFKNNEVPSKERFWYLLIFLILTTLAGFMPNVSPTYLNIFEIATTIAGLIICYNTNKSGDDKEFIERYICLGFPIAIRIIVFFVPAIILIAILSAKTADAFQLLYYAISFSFFYWRLNSAIKIASH